MEVAIMASLFAKWNVYIDARHAAKVGNCFFRRVITVMYKAISTWDKPPIMQPQWV